VVIASEQQGGVPLPDSLSILFYSGSKVLIPALPLREIAVHSAKGQGYISLPLIELKSSFCETIRFIP
jgi:hypothetical protein